MPGRHPAIQYAHSEDGDPAGGRGEPPRARAGRTGRAQDLRQVGSAGQDGSTDPRLIPTPSPKGSGRLLTVTPFDPVPKRLKRPLSTPSPNGSVTERVTHAARSAACRCTCTCATVGPSPSRYVVDGNAPGYRAPVKERSEGYEVHAYDRAGSVPVDGTRRRMQPVNAARRVDRVHRVRDAGFGTCGGSRADAAGGADRLAGQDVLRAPGRRYRERPRAAGLRDHSRQLLRRGAERIQVLRDHVLGPTRGQPLRGLGSHREYHRDRRGPRVRRRGGEPRI